ncbi:MAG: tripartite tricarboxylate transporter TctB family protein [Lachnospiraceae bacterium]|nr:tripartite tricarboxylate transporter TctB family protein [Lachnospiraceae bacterium]
MDKILSKKITVKMETLDIIAGAIVIAIGAFLLTIGIPKFIGIGFATAGTILTPRTFPRIVAVLMILLGVLLIASGLKTKAKNKKENIESKTVRFYVVSFVIMLVCVLFIELLKPLGYPIVSILTAVAMYFICGGKKWWESVVLAVLFTAVSTWFFFIYMKMSIPMGILEGIMYKLFY